MAANITRNVLFFSIIFLVLCQNVAIAEQSINLNISPSIANVGETTNFSIEFTSTQNLSRMIMHFYVDAEKKGARDAFNIEKNKQYFTTFEYFFNENSYQGEHYIELKIDFVTENQEKNSENFYRLVYVHGKKKNILYLFLLLFIITLISFYYHFNHSNISVIRFNHEDRKMLFSIMVIVLTISISIFTFTEKPELKIGIFSIFISLIASFISAFFMFSLGEKWSEVDANHFAIYSIGFLLLGLIKMVILFGFF